MCSSSSFEWEDILKIFLVLALAEASTVMGPGLRNPPCRRGAASLHAQGPIGGVQTAACQAPHPQVVCLLA